MGESDQLACCDRSEIRSESEETQTRDGLESRIALGRLCQLSHKRDPVFSGW